MMNSLFKQYEKVFDPENRESDSGDGKKKKTNFSYKPFDLQGAIGAKNTKKAWIEYQKLLIGGAKADQMIYNIAAKARDMLAAAKGASAEDLDAKDYFFAGSKRDSKNWKENELKDFYTKLITALHQSRMISGYELDIALEKIILSI